MSTTAAPGRNAPCPCGSGRKAKRCHPEGLVGAAATTAPLAAARRTVRVTEGTHSLWWTDHRSLSDAILDTAEGCLDQGLLEDVVAAASEVLEREPANPRALGLVGAAAHRMHDLATAAELLGRAVGLAPTDVDARRRLAALLVDAGEPDRAREQLGAAVAANPRDAYALADLAALALLDGDEDEAAALLGRGIAADPDNTLVRRRLTWLRLRQGRLDEARSTYEALLAWEAAHPELVLPHPRGHDVRVGPVAPVAAWCRAAGARVTVARPAGELRVERPRYAPDLVGPPPAVVLRPERYVAIVEDALAVGRETLVVASDGTILSDVASHPDAGRYDLVRGATRYADGERALLDLTAEPLVTLDRAVSLLAPGSPNYYHWLLEILTRLQTLELAGAADTADWPLLVDEAAAAIPQLIVALRMVTGPDRPLVTVPVRRAVRVRRLAVVSPGAWLPIDLRDGLMLQPHDCIVDPDAIAYLRRHLLPAGTREAQDRAGRDAPAARRVFLGRSREGRLAGAAALAPVLAARGLETVYPERLSVGEQAALFADAALVVAESGAALTNLVLAPASARILVLGADRWDLTLFSQLAGIRGQRHLYAAGRPLRGSHAKLYQSRFTIDPEAVGAAIDQLEAEA